MEGEDRKILRIQLLERLFRVLIETRYATATVYVGEVVYDSRDCFDKLNEVECDGR